MMDSSLPRQQHAGSIHERLQRRRDRFGAPGRAEMSPITTPAHRMDNSGQGPLQVPGFGAIPQDYQLTDGQRFAHSVRDWRPKESVSYQTLQMVGVINVVTDLQDWTREIFDNTVAGAFHSAAKSAFPDLTDQVWDRCLAMLRNMAAEYDHRKFNCVLDIGIRVCKSDSLLPSQLIAELASSTQSLFVHALRSQSATWSTNVSISDPFLYPLVYGRTRVLQTDASTTLENVFGRGEGEQIPPSSLRTLPPNRVPQPSAQHCRHGQMWYDLVGRERNMAAQGQRTDFQCLPCDASAGPVEGSVRIKSYINNLHPSHRLIYRQIEEIIALALDPWDACLAKCSTSPPAPAIAGHPERIRHGADYPLGRSAGQFRQPRTDSRPSVTERYHDAWQRHSPQGDDGPRLHDYLRTSGLQVIVSIESAELTRESRPYNQDVLGLQERRDERIAATAIVAFDPENVKPCYASFSRTISVAADRSDASVNDSSISSADGGDNTVWRTIGRVELRPGRLITYPSAIRSKLEPLELVNPSRKGHFRVIKIHLVDPNYRICSTANVPAQQYEWWLQTVTGLLHQKGLPAELCELVMVFCEQAWRSSNEASRRRDDRLRDDRLDDIRFRIRPTSTRPEARSGFQPTNEANDAGPRTGSGN